MCVCIFVYIYVYLCIYVCVYVRICVCVYKCMYVCMYVLCKCLYMYVFIFLCSLFYLFINKHAPLFVVIMDARFSFPVYGKEVPILTFFCTFCPLQYNNYSYLSFVYV